MVGEDVVACSCEVDFSKRVQYFYDDDDDENNLALFHHHSLHDYGDYGDDYDHDGCMQRNRHWNHLHRQ